MIRKLFILLLVSLLIMQIGTKTVSALKIGSTDIDKAYIGDKLSFSNDVLTASEVKIDGTIVRPDGIDLRDITGNGLPDVLVVEEAGKVSWYEHTSLNNFTKHTILGSDVAGAKCEGAAWQYIDGGYVAVVADQGNGEIRAYKPDTSEDYDGTWSGGALITGRTYMQDVVAYDIDGDGEEELRYTWEGSEPSTGGGIHWLKYDGSGDVVSSSNYTDNIMYTGVGCWWTSYTTRDLGGAHGASDFVFTRRDRGSNTGQGVYKLVAPSTITDPWTATAIDTADEDWLHVEFGDFFGEGNNDDILAHYLGGDAKVYKSSDSYATSETVVSSYRTSFFQAAPLPFKRNGRDRIFTTGSSGVGFRKASIFSWTGTVWEEEVTIDNVLSKMDDRIFYYDLTGNGIRDILGLQTSSFNYGLWRIELSG